ncbi:MAG: hypothetical protein QM715_04910 [Nibricoccus sp.]
MKRKVAMIQPYFGILPNFFGLALKSYECNTDFDWYIFTDDRTQYEWPTNVFVNYTNLTGLRNYFQQHFDFPLALERPYKLCDYKPIYGHLFADYLQGYDFWGHFDPDVIFGRINEFISDELYQQYDKIFDRGYFALYRNTSVVNLIYRERFARCVDYRTVLANERNWAFDEREDGVNAFFSQRNLKLYVGSPGANIFYGDYALRLHGEAKGREPKSDQSCFAYENGRVYRYFLLADGIHREEFMYIHLQKRKMEVLCRDASKYLIYRNAFREAEDITKSFLKVANQDRLFYRFFWSKRKFATRIRTAWRILVLEHDYRTFSSRLIKKMRSVFGRRWGTQR